MTATEFAYWLQGFVELSEENRGLTPAQLACVREHLKLVFTKVTPDAHLPRAAPEELGGEMKRLAEEMKRLAEPTPFVIGSPYPMWCAVAETPVC